MRVIERDGDVAERGFEQNIRDRSLGGGKPGRTNKKGSGQNDGKRISHGAYSK
jgi:hypothetical protein